MNVATSGPVGNWQWHYDRQERRPFGFSESAAFRIGAEWLRGCETVADWGCGGGLLREHVTPGRYIGIDGSKTWAVDVVADLIKYREPSDGLFMRNVLEHNYAWDRILRNAVSAFRQRMVLALFTPWHDGQESSCELRFEEEYGVPTLAFRRDAIERHLDGLRFDLLELDSGSFYKADHVYLIEKP